MDDLKIGLTMEQQFSLHQMRQSEAQLSQDQMLDLLKQAKRLYKIKSRAVLDVKNLSLECTMQDRIDIVNECERLEKEAKHVIFAELISCVEATMIKDNVYKDLITRNRTLLFS